MSSLRIAYIDGTSLDSEMKMMSLVNLGHEVIHFTNSANALFALKQTHFDVIVTIDKIPNLNGVELFLELKKFHKKNILGILISSYQYLPFQEAMNIGFSGYLEKNFSEEDLIYLIEKMNQQNLAVA